MFGDGKIMGSLCCGTHEMMELRITRRWNEAKGMITGMDFWKEDVVLCRDLIGRISWDIAPEKRQV